MEQPRPRLNETGFSLLEVLITALLLAIALLALAGLAVRGLDEASHARDAFVAHTLLADLAGRARLTGGAAAWQSPTGLAASERDHWGADARAALPAGHGVICRDSTPRDGAAGVPACDGTGTPVAKLFWRRGQAARREVREIAP